MSSSAEADKKRARRIAMLRRRAAHLQERIAANPGRNLAYDLAEASALRWAAVELEKIYPPNQRTEPDA